MAKKKRKSPYSSPENPVKEKRIQYMSADLRETEIKEFSEVSPATAREFEGTYEQLCGALSLIPTPHGWGLLHCTVRDRRGRRKRVTLATDDLTYHRAFAEAGSQSSRKEYVELAVARYPFMRAGWPGPPRQSGSWLNGRLIPWQAAYRSACPDPTTSDHFHAVQVTASGVGRGICTVFSKSPSGVKWIMLDDEPMQAESNILILESEVNFYFPSGAAVMPGWPSLSGLEPCLSPDCS